MQQISASVIWDDLKPRIDALIATRISASGVRSAGASGGAVSAHALSGALHTGLLGDGQAPQFLLRTGGRSLTGDLAVESGITIDGVDLSAHVLLPNIHHNQAHVLATDVALGGDHTVSGATAGHVLRASGATTALFAQLQHADLGGVTSDQHHAKLHAMLDTDHHSYSGGAAYDVFGLSAASTLAKLTPSYDVSGGASALLRSNAGALGVATLTAGTKVTTPLIDTASGDLTLQPADDVILDPASNIVKLVSAVAIGTDNYASQTTGWRADYAGGADFRYVFTDELHAKSFIADLEQALAGGQIISKSVAMLGAAFTAPAASGTATLTVRDLPSAENMAVFVSGDIVRIRTFSRAAGSLTIADCWGVVTDYADQADKLQTWTFTRSAAPNAGAMADGTVVAVDSIVLDYGTTGNGFHEVNAIDGAYGVNSPYAQIVTWATHPATGQTVRTRTGNLYGLFAVANEYGLYAGNGVTDSDAYLRMSSYTNRFNNLTSEWYTGGAKFLGIDATGGVDIIAASTTAESQIRAYSYSYSGAELGGLYGYRDSGDGKRNVLVKTVATANPSAVSMQSKASATYEAIATAQSLSGAESAYIEVKSDSSTDAYGSGINSVITLTADKIDLAAASGQLVIGAYNIWHANNDGTGSGLDADLLDGSHAAAFAALAGATFSGTVSVSSPNRLNVNTIWADTSAGLGLKDDAGNLGVFVEDGGYVGLLMNNPAHPFHLYTSVADTVAKIHNTNAAGYGLKIVNGDDNKYALYIQNAAESAGRHVFYGTGHAYLSLGGGAVGIGIDTPVSGSKVHVVGGTLIVDDSGEHKIGQAGDTYGYFQAVSESRYKIGCWDTSAGARFLSLQEAGGNVTIGASDNTAMLDIAGYSLRIRNSNTRTASQTGSAGMIGWDANYLYVCTATNTWKRVALSTIP